jgi:hypothetical protein
MNNQIGHRCVVGWAPQYRVNVSFVAAKSNAKDIASKSAWEGKGKLAASLLQHQFSNSGTTIEVALDWEACGESLPGAGPFKCKCIQKPEVLEIDMDVDQND